MKTIRIPTGRRGRKFSLLLDDFRGGTNTLLDEARIKTNQAVAIINLMQVQDGLWKTRWGRAYYGNAISGESSLDGVAEYVKNDNSREIIAVGGTTGKIYKSTDAQSWSEVTGVVMTPGNNAAFKQIESRLYIANGADPLVHYNGTTLTTFTELSAPINVALTRGAGLSAGSYTLYYVITALNEVGETVGSTEVNITSNKERDIWTAATEKIDITWDAVATATRYQIYYSDESGAGELIDAVSTNSYSDTGAKVANPYVIIPDDNTTGAPRFRDITLSGNRIWATNDPNNPHRVHFSGTGQYMGYFSPFYGGGYIDLEKGGRERPTKVVHYRTGRGNSIATVLTSSPEGIGSIWQISLESVTIDDTTFVIPVPTKIVGSIGSDAIRATVMARDNVFFPNRRGVFALRNKAQMYNVLSSDELSVGIRPSYRGLRGDVIGNAAGYYHEGKVFFSMAFNSAQNDRILIYDLERNNWTWYWDFGVTQFLEVTDTAGNTHFLGVSTSTGQLVEISSSHKTDFGAAITTKYISGLIPVSRTRRDFATVKDVIFEIGRPEGVIEVEVLGLQKAKGFRALASRTITSATSNIKFTNGLWGEYAWGNDPDVPVTFSQASVKKRLKVGKLLNAIQFIISSTTAGTVYTLQSIHAAGKIKPTKPPSDWN